MFDLLTAAQMRGVEAAAIGSGAVTGRVLMERAGAGVVAVIEAARPTFARRPGRALVLAGPGNNGGDGFVIARLLSARGWAVEVAFYGDLSRLPPDAAANARLWQDIGAVSDLETTGYAGPVPPHDLVIDALFGTGLTRPLTLDLAGIIGAQAPDGSFRVAVDVPSGLCADSGRALGGGDRVLPADLTVTFHARKLGHFLADGPRLCGDLVVQDIGLASPNNDSPSTAPARLVTTPGGGLQKTSGHKFSHGHALVLSGPSGHTGAARLAARGSLRIGAGLVTVATPASALAETAAQLTAIMAREVEGAQDLSRLLDDPRINALALGPGLGLARARDLVPVALAGGRACVLDADALTAFADDPAALFDVLHPACVLTPHGGEFARLFPDLADRLAASADSGPAYSKLDATRAAAARAGCAVLFKGEDTVIAEASGAACVHAAAYDRAAPWLATAGSGDVLCGFIVGLLARGQTPLAAASQAAWLHVEAARSFGPGLIAEDIPDEVPKVFGALGLGP